eukprot:CAMPEP_0194445842 /NCGR_PEP_ID=MMETSP0176-20130528/128091_1 /TAXON_ID=216777 /ORGANISM="Proboscia alata, Strain PI-D3" /LENGTH=637 /DNA_ID=CAMNT_0039272457 /DNA_START=17 /DNA_END=1930 /DNA_ORIENTATION=+
MLCRSAIRLRSRVCVLPTSIVNSYFSPRTTATDSFLIAPFRRFSDQSTITSPTNPFKVAIVGSGPSGFYTAKYLLKEVASTADNPLQCSIDILEKLPTPYGLVRSGVAPDHPDVKNVENEFAAILDSPLTSNDSSPNPPIQFYGNIKVGDPSTITLPELLELYDAVVLTYGCDSDRSLGIPGEDLEGVHSAREFVSWYNGCDSDRSLGIPGEELEGVHSAREFVSWYNGHPDYVHFTEVFGRYLKNATAKKQTRVVIVGQGNVALDCARILTKSVQDGKDSLFHTDITQHSLSVLGNNDDDDDDDNNTSGGGGVAVSIVGRRGHVQGSFTIKELRELTKMEKNHDCTFVVRDDHVQGSFTIKELRELTKMEKNHDCTFVVRDDELELGGSTPSSQVEVTDSRAKKRIDKLLRSVSTPTGAIDETESATKNSIHIRYLWNPISFNAPTDNNDNSQSQQSVKSVTFERTRLTGEPHAQTAVGTGEYTTLPADLVLKSIGYKGRPLPGLDELGVDSGDVSVFDERRGVIRNINGRVGVERLYVAGWIKRGPSGIIGTNITDARDTVASMLEDLPLLTSTNSNKLGRDGLLALLTERNVKVVDWNSWREINRVETDPGRRRSDSQPREKLVSVDGMLDILN